MYSVKCLSFFYLIHTKGIKLEYTQTDKKYRSQILDFKFIACNVIFYGSALL